MTLQRRFRHSVPSGVRRSGSVRLAMVATIVALALVAAACGDDTPSESSGDTPGRTRLRVSYVPATTVLPLHIAEVRGIFDRNGLDVTLEQAANISDIPATLGRQFDLALGTATDLIRAGAAGIDVVQAAGNTVSSKENPFVQIIVKPDSGITGVGDLRGKRIGTPTLSGVIHVGVQYWAQQGGIDPGEIEGVEAPSPNLPDQLTAGRIDAVEALEPFASQLKAAGNVSIGDPFSPIADPLATNFWMAQGSWANDNRDAVARFVDSLEEGQAFIDENPTEARRILQDYTGMPEAVASSVPLPTYDFDIRADDLDEWVRVLREVSDFDGEVNTDELVLSSDD